ncbi:MAG: nitric-oxide reductase large subunit [Acidimicrobiales bacterium]
MTPHDPPRSNRRWWIALVVVLVGSFSVLLWQGREINDAKPPIPDRFVAADGSLITGDDVREGQAVWQSIGGQEIGSVWGHGAYVAPDWTADWLHREATFILDRLAAEEGAASFDDLDAERQAALQARLTSIMRTNTYDEATGTVTLDPIRIEAFEANRDHYADIFMNGYDNYAIPAGTVADRADVDKMSAFFFWTSWAASTDRPGDTVSYTQNWPHEPLIDNVPTTDNVFWSVLSVVLLLAGIAGMVWYHSSLPDDEPDLEDIPIDDPLLGYQPTPSQKATLKFFFLVGGLFVLQIACGVLLGHYGVEGDGLYGIPIDKILPYAVLRTWHTQLAIFWIATAWLATGLYIGPAVGGREPKHQRLAVNVLFGALIVVVLGSMFGEWLSITGRLGRDHDAWFWFGTQGLEYVDLGRVFQIGLTIGLILWLVLMTRAMLPALRKTHVDPSDRAPLALGGQRSLIAMLLLSCVAITGFYLAAFGIGSSTHLSVIEYWRWWVVHLWVEGFFEVFATAVIAFMFTRLRLIRPVIATNATLASTVIFLSGGIIGTFHHLYFSGTPKTVLALGASFSALEVVPLALMGFEAVRHLELLKVRRWVAGYKWAIYFFVSVSFWNLVGAGLFGFLINPPISLYYVQGLNLTPLHGHTALFGVYGMLGIGLMLFCIRSLRPGPEWNDGPIKLGFWGLNIGLATMSLFSLLPVGLGQAWASIDRGLWWARSDEFLYGDTMTFFRWMRIPGDTIFAFGALAIGVFMVGLLTGWSLKGDDEGGVLQSGSLETTPAPEERDVTETAAR